MGEQEKGRGLGWKDWVFGFAPLTGLGLCCIALIAGSVKSLTEERNKRNANYAANIEAAQSAMDTARMLDGREYMRWDESADLLGFLGFERTYAGRGRRVDLKPYLGLKDIEVRTVIDDQKQDPDPRILGTASRQILEDYVTARQGERD